MQCCFIRLNFFQIIYDPNKTFNIILLFYYQHFLFHLTFIPFKLFVINILIVFNFIWIFLPPSLARWTTRFTNNLNFLIFFRWTLTIILRLRLVLLGQLVNLILMLYFFIHELIHKIIKSKNNHKVKIQILGIIKQFLKVQEIIRINFLVSNHFQNK